MDARIVIIDGAEYAISEREGVTAVDGHPGRWDVLRTGAHTFAVRRGAATIPVVVVANDDGFDVLVESNVHTVRIDSARGKLLKQLARHSGAATGRREVRAPMPAMIVKVEVTAGVTVKEGDGLLILEAMKMENEVKAPMGGIVRQVLVTPGAAVEKGQLLVVIE
jgi:biotin carboxyl carrier protein